MILNRNLYRTMETRDHSKNGASLKSLTSRIYNLIKCFSVFYWFFPMSIGLIVLSGCASTNIPITKSIINEVGGGDNTKKFQYYVSKTITLKLDAESRTSTIEGGQLIRRKQRTRDKIVITEKLPGLVRTASIDNRTNGDGFLLNVAFENYEGNPTIQFGQYRKGFDIKYQILYKDSQNKTIQYGNDRYVVSYDGDEAPYLLIREKEFWKESDKSRKASGLKLGQ